VNSFTTPFVSVIIPVFNDAERLSICLEALENQTYPQASYEVIVIDNASDDGGKIKEVVARYPQATYAFESSPGSYAARNKGIALAKGEIVAFTDADCIPALDWLEKGSENLLRVPNCGLVAGNIEIFFKNPEKLTTVELYESLMALPQKEFLEVHHYGATANVFTFKTVIDRVGIFNAKLKSSGDVEWGQRVYACGYQQVYGSDVCVAHPARNSFAQLYKRTIRHAGGVYDLHHSGESSFFKRNQLFLNYLGFNLMPPLMFAYSTFLNPKLKNINQKLQVAFVMFYIRYTTAWELCKLKLGGISARE
jgi:glycosyltransferase involved in cell wall biosynthesis